MLSEGASIEFSDNGPVDCESLNELWRLVGWDRKGTRTVEKTSQALKRSDYYVCAHCGNRLVGFARVCGDPYIAQVLDVIVHPEFRRRGIATELMSRIVGHLERAGYVSVTLTDGAGIDGFYEKYGFRKIDPSTPARVFRPQVPEGRTV